MANVHFEWLILNNGVEWLAHETTSDRASGHNILMLTIYRARASSYYIDISLLQLETPHIAQTCAEKTSCSVDV